MKLVHIAQTHANTIENNPRLTKESFELTVKSQFAVAQLIRHNPNCPVVDEGIPSNLSSRRFSQGYFRFMIGPYRISGRKIREIFPAGLPDNYDDLNRDQKEALYCGATLVLLSLNIIPVLYSSSDKITRKAFNNFIRNAVHNAYRNSGMLNSMILMREKAAIEAVKRAAAVHYKQVDEASVVILVYGAAHDFQNLCTQNGLCYKKIYTVPLHLQKYPKRNYDSHFFSTHQAPSYWNRSEVCDLSKLDIDKINAQDTSYTLEKTIIISSLVFIAEGTKLLATYFFFPVANPSVLLITGILLIGIGLIVGRCLFADYLKDRYDPLPAKIGIVIEDEENQRIEGFTRAPGMV